MCPSMLHLYIFTHLQGRWINNFPEQAVPVLHGPSREKLFSNIQSKPLLEQPETISYCPVTRYLGEEADPHLGTTSFHAVVESEKA